MYKCNVMYEPTTYNLNALSHRLYMNFKIDAYIKMPGNSQAIVQDFLVTAWYISTLTNIKSVEKKLK